MDRNTIIGLLLIGVILIGFQYYSGYTATKTFETKIVTADSLFEIKEYAEARKIYEEAIRYQPEASYPRERILTISNILKPSEEEAKREQERQKKENLKPVVTDGTVVSDSADTANEEPKGNFGDFSDAATGEEKFFTLENERIRAKFTNKGGRLYSVELKEYKTYEGDKLFLFDGDDNIFRLNFYTRNLPISTDELFFKNAESRDNIVVQNDEGTIRLRLHATPDKYIEFEYKLAKDSYIMQYNINFVGLENLIASNYSAIDLKWQIDVPGQEKGRDWETQNTSIYYKHFLDDVDNLSERSDEKEERIRTKVRWIAFKQQFFSSILVAHDYMNEAYVHYVKNETHPRYIMQFTADISLPYEGKGDETIPMSFYFGPNHYKTLSTLSDKVVPDIDMEFQNVIHLGWLIFGWVNRFAIIPLFNFLGTFISNYGLLIFVLTLIIKMVLFPFTYKSYLSSAKMRVLKPQIEEINKKIPKDKAMERQQATMALYRKVGVNPMGGCLPMLFQMPILFAMFLFFPASIELRQKSFLWADDLSTYDSILELPFEIPFYGDHVSLFTLLMAVTIVISTKMSTGQMGDTNAQMPGMKTMMYMMPVFMVFWFNSYSAGLSYYYFLSTSITILQTYAIRMSVNDEEILKKLNANKKKPTKKSKFQTRLEEMAKQKGYQPPKRK